MEKRAMGMILTLLGVIALIIGAVTFVNHTGDAYNAKVIITCLSLGLIFLFAGIDLARGTKDTLRNDERVS